MTTTSPYRVSLDVYSGPLDLLLFLIRRDEVDVYDIPIAHVMRQYLEYVELLKQLDPEAVSEFLVVAATLMEIKSRMLLPTPPVEEGEEESADPRMELVRQLLAYKQFKDAARSLEQAAIVQAQKHARSPVMPPLPADEVELENLDIWDLFAAFNKLLTQTGRGDGVHRVDVDDTPVRLHAEDILDALQRGDGAQPFADIFAGRTKGEMIGLFLALLELIRQRRVRAVQDRPFGVITLHLLDARPLDEVAPEVVEESAEAETVEGVSGLRRFSDEDEDEGLGVEDDSIEGFDDADERFGARDAAALDMIDAELRGMVPEEEEASDERG